MTDDEFEALLWREESDSLDFKRDQYPLARADDNQKSELVKDILALANSWRESDGHVLVDVEEVKGGKSIVHGVAEHLEDSHVQQLVNGKTQRPVRFSYSARTFGCMKVGIIHVPTQKRPLYLKKNFGKLDANCVYVRRGSATDVARPEEVAAMGGAATSAQPELSIEFAISQDRARLGKTATTRKTIVELASGEVVPELGNDPWVGPLFNRDYWQELIDYHQDLEFLCPVDFALVNGGSAAARGVRVEIDIEDGARELRVLGEDEAPTEPSREIPSAMANFRGLVGQHQDVSVQRVPSGWRIDAEFSRSQPRKSDFSQSRCYIGSKLSKKVEFVCRIYGDNISEPIENRLELLFEVAQATTTVRLIMAADAFATGLL